MRGGHLAGFPVSMSMLKQASSQPWLSSKSWLLEFEIVVGKIIMRDLLAC